MKRFAALLDSLAYQPQRNGKLRLIEAYLREVGDPDRGAHFQHEYLPALTHQTGLHHQLRRFRDRHEIAGDFLMRHGHWAALLDLLPEQGNYGAAGTKHTNMPT